MDPKCISHCEEVLDYTFTDKRLLEVAMCHTSAATTRELSNERMEFLGDAVLGLSVVSQLYCNRDQLHEGEMTKIKSTVVSRRTCAEIVRAMGLDAHLHTSVHMSKQGIPESVAAGLLEGIIGAIFIDGGYAEADTFVRRITDPYIEQAMSNNHHEDYKSLLQQHVSQETGAMPKYSLLDEQGPKHSRCFEVGVVLEGEVVASAWSNTKKKAEQHAAHAALIKLKVLDE